MTPMIVEHPLLQHKISLLRNKQTGTCLLYTSSPLRGGMVYYTL